MTRSHCIDGDMCISSAVKQNLTVILTPRAKLSCVPIAFTVMGLQGIDQKISSQLERCMVLPLSHVNLNFGLGPKVHLWTPEPWLWVEATQQPQCDHPGKENSSNKISAQKRCCRGWSCGHPSQRMTSDLGSKQHPQKTCAFFLIIFCCTVAQEWNSLCWN